MKTLIICESVHHGCTKKVADSMAGPLKAEVKKPGEVDADLLATYDLIGFGGTNKGRPDESDLEKAREFAARVAGK
ncbi:hypothetical protein [Methanocella arvoryzae]|uniref:Flavodoxin-like domain-containing protein n=1 Tax=Methanocella arvoryzae (strain DSM 22066 / NBRC 105507 / MRE50) TaxID=351160 RepID=Q0W3P8_METAR|nr:hypothetical protein [Methanocella arvoryzae]CAJ36995.1 hypothetical protein RCIX1798 [Methanocella arvoryzae MRE50]